MADQNPAKARAPPVPIAPRRPRVGRPIGSGGHRQRRDALAQEAAAAAAAVQQSAQTQLELELRQLRQMQAMELELRQLQQMQVVQQRQLERGEVQRRQVQEQAAAAAAATAAGRIGEEVERPASAGPLAVADLLEAEDGGTAGGAADGAAADGGGDLRKVTAALVGGGIGTSRAEATAVDAGVSGGDSGGDGDSGGAAGAVTTKISCSDSAGHLSTFATLMQASTHSGQTADALLGASVPPTFASHSATSASSSLPPQIAAAQARADALEGQLAAEQNKEEELAALQKQQQQQLGGGSDVPPHIAAIQARAQALERQLATEQAEEAAAIQRLRQKRELEREAAIARQLLLQQQQMQMQMYGVGATSSSATGGSESGASSVAAATSAGGSGQPSAAAAAKRLPLPPTKPKPNPRRPPNPCNSGFPLPRLSTVEDAYVPPKIKSLDGFRSAYQRMRKNLDDGKRKKKRKASVALGDEKREMDMDNDDDDDDGDGQDIPLPKATFTGDIFSNMICRGRIDLKEHDLTITGMYSVNGPGRIVEDQPTQHQKQQQEEEEEEGHAQVASDAPAAPAETAPQPPPRKKQKTPEQLQMIAELKRQKAMLDEQLARYEQLNSAKEKGVEEEPAPVKAKADAPEPAAQPVAAPQPEQEVKPQSAQGLLPPILPNTAMEVNKGQPQCQEESVQQKLEAIARLEQEKAQLEREKAILDARLAAKRDVAPAQLQQAQAQDLLPPILLNSLIGKQGPEGAANPTDGEPSAMAVENGTKPVSSAHPRPLVSNIPLGAAASLLGLVSQPQAKESPQPETESDIPTASEDNTKKRGIDALASISAPATEEPVPYSPRTEERMKNDLETIGKRKKARRLSKEGVEESAVETMPG